MHRPLPGRRLKGRGHPNTPSAVAPAQSTDSGGFPCFPPFYSQPFYSLPYWNFPPAASPLAHGIPQLHPFPYVQSTQVWGPQVVNSPGKGPEDLCGRVEAALEKAHSDLLAAGDSVSGWKVSQAALISLQADSWASLGFQFQDIPFLRRLVAAEGKVNAFIHCFVGVWKIASVHDLDVAICKNEGIEQFDALGLGPLLRHPLVSHYFSIPPDAAEVPKITAEEIVSCLSFYVDNVKKMVVPDEFLTFLMAKYGVSSKEKLGVRIQSIGLHLAFIRDAKKAEHFALKKCLDNTSNKKGETEGRPASQPPNMFSEKPVLDRRFGYISRRMKSFSSACDGFEGKHIKFDSSGEDDSQSDSKSYGQGSPRSNSDLQQRVSSCPYPSTTEEIKRLGLQPEVEEKTSSSIKTHDYENKRFSGRKRKHGDQSYKMKMEKRFSFDRGTMQEFIKKWKKTCRNCSVLEVLNRMQDFYSFQNKLRKKGSKRAFSSYPGIGLLNVAVAAIKSGMLDSIYDAFDDVEQGLNCGTPALDGDIASELLAEKDDISMKKMCTSRHESRVTDDAVLKKIACYFEADCPQTSGDRLLEKKIAILRQFRDCEVWLEREFSVDAFCSLGYGHLVDFLERNLDRLPVEVCRRFEDSSKFRLEVNHHQLETFLSQACKTVVDVGVVSQPYISMLLEKQFPILCFDFVGHEADSNFQDLFEKKGSDPPNGVYYSATLLGKFFMERLPNVCCGRYSPVAVGNGIKVDDNTDHSDNVSPKDAVECLLKVPMLSDLISWTHWDIVFAPKFGPLLAWLSEEARSEELSCIATSDGRLIRIDHSSTVDEFLDALICCSPFRAALKLLSLLALYGGTSNIPITLLKCYSQRAMDAIFRSCMECLDIDPVFQFPNETEIQRSDSNNSQLFADTSRSTLYTGSNIAASFVLDCLEHIPTEFRSFAAEILMSGLRSSVKDASRIMLNECKRTEQRIMLHAIGFSLGIVEWIEDYNLFKLETWTDSVPSFQGYCQILKSVSPSADKDKKNAFAASVTKVLPSNQSSIVDSGINTAYSDLQVIECTADRSVDDNDAIKSEDKMFQDASDVIESIRREEFGLYASSSFSDSTLLKKQHARLGRALHCLSQELYSQDSHLLLELVQNADDNTYSGTVEPTLVFILQADAIVILNNERGFSAENIRALCDIGNSTKKGSSAGYIGHKGIGFKSVFRVTDAPEIHSNGFHVKFDISEGPIGFVLPTVIPAHDIRPFERQLSSEIDRDIIPPSWSTCIVLPLRPKLKERSGMSSIVTMFSDLHPSLLLFLHRLECMKFMNALDGSLIVMKKETLGDGMVRVSYGNEKMDWLVVRQKLQPTVLRPGVQMTEIALAFTLQETETGEYTPYLNQQPAFAFLPLRTYGLKFILQADFVLPSSREEIDGNSAWNQWLLSEFPVLFVNAEACFTALPCYKKCPGKAVSAYMSFVPNIGEVHGFFSNLPQMIVSKLRVSRCLLLEGHEMEWVLPCKALKGWDERARKLISDSLLQRHLGLGFLDRNITLSNSLVKTLGVRDYGPKVLTDILSSICRDRREIKELGFEWLSDCLVALSIMLSHNSYDGMETDVISHLRRIPFIPLADGSYGSTAEGPIWLPGESENIIHDYHFPRLYAKLCTVDPVFLSLNRDIEEKEEGSRRDIVVRLLEKFGVQQLSAHEVIMSHILPAVSAARYSAEDKNLMVEYLSYVMLHFQNVCSNCQIQRKRIVLDLQKSASILTNHGYKCSAEVPLHFSQAFGNPFEIDKLIDPKDDEWNAVDEIYLQHYSVGSSASLLAKWRKFLQELGVSDFVQVLRVEKKLKDDVSGESQIIAWESPELSRLLSTFSSGKHKEKCRYLLEVLDKKWDELSSEAENYAREASVDGRPQRPPFLKCIHDFRWIGSTADEELHYPKDVFCDCEEVRCMLGSFAPYAIPQVKSKKLLEELGFKTQVSCEDALEVLELCGARCSGTQVSASTMQMSKLYNFIWEAVTTERLSMRRDQLRSLPLKIFVPCSSNSTWSETVQAGAFLSPNHVYWRDPTGCLDVIPGRKYKTLFKLYPSLQDFFVGECGVLQTPSFGDYVDILLELSKVTLPAQAAHLVFRVFVKWAGLVEGEEIARLRESLRKAENTVLPTKQGRWVSLHPSSGIVCRSDDIGLEEQFMDSRNLHFIHFGELSGDDSEILSGKVSPLLKKLGVVAFSEIVSREAIFYGTEDCREKASLICWALPYAQRYVLQSRPDEFAALKKLASERLPLLRTVCVDKLFYRYIIKISEGASRKRYECSCLLQDNVFYVTRTSDSHSIFLELSRLFFNGAPELQFANFLHMIRIMAESGSAEEQIEFFIVNSQKVPALPAEEPVWSLSPASSSSQAPRARKTCPPSLVSMPQTAPSFWRTTGISANWPPTDWKTAPDFTGARHFGASGTAVEEIFEVDGDWMAAVEESSSAAPVDAPGRFRPEPEAGAADPGDSEDVPLCLGGLGLADSQQQHRTGFIGEAVAFKYLRDKCSGSGSVKWVNEEGETGLPYDLIVEDEGGRKEYVEVKATRVATKYWFPITAREWQFAAEAGEAYSIAHVSLAGGKTARVTLLKNPLRLCQQNALNLALFMRKQ